MPKSTKTIPATTTRTRTRKSSTTTPAPPIISSLSLSHADIASRAYELFLANGASHGRDVEHWLQAESELRDRSVSVGQ